MNYLDDIISIQILYLDVFIVYKLDFITNFVETTKFKSKFLCPLQMYFFFFLFDNNAIEIINVYHKTLIIVKK